MVPAMTDPMDNTLGRQRYTQSSVCIQTGQGPLDIIPACGGLQGDPYVVRQWVHGFKPLVTAWQAKYFQLRDDASVFFAQIPGCQETIDLSYAVYADDSHKTVAVSHQNRSGDFRVHPRRPHFLRMLRRYRHPVPHGADVLKQGLTHSKA